MFSTKILITRSKCSVNIGMPVHYFEELKKTRASVNILI